MERPLRLARLLLLAQLPNLVACGASSRASETAESTPADAGADARIPAAAELEPGRQLFARGTLLKLEFTLSDADWTELEEHGDREEYVESTLAITGAPVENSALGSVGLRHKGSYSLHHCWDLFGGQRSYADECAKLSLKVKFDEYAPEQRLDGLKRLNLHALQGDPTKMHELLGYEAFRAFGIQAPRIVPATVSVNGIQLGLFMAVEEIDGRFAKAHFEGTGNGNLYKETWPIAALPDQDFIAALETNEELADVSDMRAFAQAVTAASAASLEDDLAAHVDLDQLLRYLAVDRAIKNWDGVTTFYSVLTTPHNMYWYFDQGDSEQFRLVPWDLDNTFDRDLLMEPSPGSLLPPAPNWNQAPQNCDARVVLRPEDGVSITPCRCDELFDLLATGAWDRFATLGRELLAGPFDVRGLHEQVDHWMAVLEPLLVDDPLVDVEAWRSIAGNWRDETLPGLASDFDALLNQGLIEESAGRAPELPPPAVQVSTDTGFSTTALNGFEFEGEEASLTPTGIASQTDGQSRVDVVWNTNDPIAGAADLRFDFTFARSEGAYSEYVGVSYYGMEGDVSQNTLLVLRMKASPARKVRLALESDVYLSEFGGAWSEFNVELDVTESARQFILPLEEFAYAPWAKEVWTEGQGWTTTDGEARELVLQHLTGLIFNPEARTDTSGELPAAEDLGSLQVDEIFLQ